MLIKNGGGDHKRQLSRVHYICTMHCVQCTLEKQCTAHHVIISNSEANEIDNLIGFIPSIKDKRFAQESDFDKFGRELVSQLYALGDQLKENKAISVTAIRNRLHDYQSQIENIALRMADNHTADCDNLMDWMDFAAGLPVC